MYKAKKEACYPRYLVNVVSNGKVSDGVWTETLRKAIEIKKKIDKKKGMEAEVYDMTYLDEVSGYKDWIKARAEWWDSPQAVWCMQTGKVYKNDAAAARATKESRYYVKQSYLLKRPTPKGFVWKKITFSK